MPFTPFHMGPGIALKAVTDKYFSLIAFGVAQVAMDIQPLVGMLRGAAVLHGWTHTYLGAALIGAVVALITPALFRPILRSWNDIASEERLEVSQTSIRIRWGAAATGAFLGTFSHVALDSLMHADMHPLAPWSDSNTMLDKLPVARVYAVCVITGALGTILWFAIHQSRNFFRSR